MNHGNDEREGEWKHPYIHQNTNFNYIFFEIQQKYVECLLSGWEGGQRFDHSFSLSIQSGVKPFLEIWG